MLKCYDCGHVLNDPKECEVLICLECGSFDLEEIEINCAHCSMFVGAMCTAPKCVYGKFDK